MNKEQKKQNKKNTIKSNENGGVKNIVKKLKKQDQIQNIDMKNIKQMSITEIYFKVSLFIMLMNLNLNYIKNLLLNI